ncbi:MAG: carboxypeptidase-like regulatory domain-containing protein [Gemmatimonadota bacterium]
MTPVRHRFRPPRRRTLLRNLPLLACLLSPSAAWAQVGNDVPGVVLEASTRVGIPDVILRIRGTDISAATDGDGRFVLRGVPSGTWTLDVTHIRYGEQSHEIAVETGIDVSLEIRLAEEAIQLEPMLVEAETAVERERRTTGASFWEVTREEFDQAVHTSRHMGDVLRQTIPGLKLRQGSNMARNDICLEFRAAASISIVNNRPCNHPKVILDGIPVSDPQYLYGAIPLTDIHRIQVIPPGEASTRWGSGSLYGVLVIETQRPGLLYEANEPRAPTGSSTFDWDLDPEGHSTWKTFLGSALGNAVGLAAGVVLARQCFDKEGPEITGSCGTFANTMAGVGAVALPIGGSVLGARIAGGTELSQGSLVPAAIGAGLMVFPGYALSISEAGASSDLVSGLGTAFLVAGVPLAVTLADKLYRKLR